MDKKKLQKGMYGFLNKKKKHEIMKTIVFFGIALAVYFLGLWQSGTNKNLLTIVSIVGMLPASKAAVSMIMFVRYKVVSEHMYMQLEDINLSTNQNEANPFTYEKCNGLVLFDLIFVLNEKVVKTDCIFVKDTSLTVFTVNSQMPDNEISKYLKNFLANQGKGNVSVKVCKTEKAFLEQVKSRMNNEVSENAVENQHKIRDMLFGFSM